MLSAPVLLTDAHDLQSFDSGQTSLDDWLRRRARANQLSGASRTYVVCDAMTVVGFYCLSSGALAAVDAPGAIRRNMPDPLPMIVLGRLAIDRTWQGKGLGSALLRDAFERASQAADILGIRGTLVHALSEEAAAFYRYYGFTSSPTNPMTLTISLKRSL